MNGSVPSVADQVHAQRTQWSAAATAAKKQIVFWRGVVLILGVSGAVLATLGAQLGDAAYGSGRWLALAGGIAIGLVPFVTLRRLGRERIQSWTRLRSVAEALKSELYRYVTQVGEYSGEDRDQKLLDAAHDLRWLASDLAPSVLRIDSDQRPLPEISDIQSYISKRVDDQILSYYRPRAAEYARRLDRLQAAEFVVGLTAAALGVAAASTGEESLGAWVPVLTTIGVALLAHAAASRYQEDTLSFAQTADRLEYLRDSWRTGRASANAADVNLIEACEDAISLENQGWMARWSAMDGEEQPPEEAAR